MMISMYNDKWVFGGIALLLEAANRVLNDHEINHVVGEI